MRTEEERKDSRTLSLVRRSHRPQTLSNASRGLMDSWQEGESAMSPPEMSDPGQDRADFPSALPI
jgi:hypothetical protein